MGDIFSNTTVIENLTSLFVSFFVAFIIAFLLTPVAGKIALQIGAVALPGNMRSSKDRSKSAQIHEGIKPRLGGLSVAAALFVLMLLSDQVPKLGTGVFVGLAIIVVVGFFDDKFELSGSYQLVGHILAAAAIVWSGISIPNEIFIFTMKIDLNWFSTNVELFGRLFEFIFPAHIITILWIVGITNIVNWVGGVDGLNISVTSVIGFTMLIFALNAANIPLATLISIHLGATLGLLPYNWYPSKIIPGGISDYINGFMLSIFALLGNTGWTISLIILALPIIDAIIVVIKRVRTNREVLTNPLKILSISDTNHFHHRILAIGYSRKTVLFIEVSIVAVICAIALFFGIDTNDTSYKIVLSGFMALTFLLSMFTLIYYLKQREEQRKQVRLLSNTYTNNATNERRQPVVKVIIEDKEEKESDDYERFVY